MLEATAEANNLTAQAAAIDRYNKEMEEVSSYSLSLLPPVSYSQSSLIASPPPLVVWC